MYNSIEELLPGAVKNIVPLNQTIAALDSTPNVSLSASTASTQTVPAGTNKIEIIPDSIPATPIYVKYSFGAAAGTDATATAYDQKLCDCKPLAEFVCAHNVSHISFFTTTACTISVIYT